MKAAISRTPSRALAALVLVGLAAAGCSTPAEPTAMAPSGAPGAPEATEAPPAAPAAGDPAHGEEVYQATCSACHGPDARGLEGLGKDLHDNAFLAEKTDEEAVAFLKVGRPAGDPLNTTGVDMPPKGGNPALTDADLADVVAYLRTLK